MISLCSCVFHYFELVVFVGVFVFFCVFVVGFFGGEAVISILKGLISFITQYLTIIIGPTVISDVFVKYN